jgi:predicted flavoprotein YhiN
MSKKIPNLYFAGEILDVDGITGGFNFQHAWTSGWIAAKAIAQSTS